MTLADEIRNIPTDEWYNGFNPGMVLTMLHGVSLVEDEIEDISRWFVHHRAVFKKRTIDISGSSAGITYHEDYAAVEYVEPATEYGDASDEPWEVYPVEAEEFVLTRYVRV